MANVSPQRDAIESIFGRVPHLVKSSFVLFTRAASIRSARLDDGHPLSFLGVSLPRGIDHPERVAVFGIVTRSAGETAWPQTPTEPLEDCTAAVVIVEPGDGHPLAVELLELILCDDEVLLFSLTGIRASYAPVFGAAA